MHDPPMGYRSTPAVNPGLPPCRACMAERRFRCLFRLF
jgi:hypothetical protein